MLDETTYYFTAFAIDQNNNIIDSQTQSITTDFGWHVTPNTLLYIPFTGNYNDQIGNTMELRKGTAPTYSTTAAGEYYANVSNSLIGTTLNSLDINSFTVSQWIYKTSTSIDVIWYFGGNVDTSSGYNTGYGTGLFINNRRLTIFVYNGDTDTGVDITLNAWHNVVFTISNDTTKIYVDGDLKKTITKTYNKGALNIFRIFANPFSSNLGNPYVGKYDGLIVEKLPRSASQVLKYYDKTKSLYGIS